MTSWSHGYVADAPYTFSYHAAQVPAHLAMATALNGVAWQPREEMVVADIGCGRGLTLNLLAASNPGWRCIGIDYAPAHIAEAAALAEAGGLENAEFLELDLAAMTDAEMDRLPPLDVAMLHGVWTWVSDEVRAGIVRLLQRRLKPGGIAYIAYNSLPGFAADQALQRVMRQGAMMQPRGDSAARAAAAVPLVRALHQSQAKNLGSSAFLERLLDEEKPLDPSYLAHEFMTQHWRPAFFADLCEALAPARLDYVGSATLLDNVPDLLFSPEQRAIWDSMPDAMARELIKDVCTSRSFRRDIFIRGARRTDMNAALDGLVLGMTRATTHPLAGLSTPVGVAELAPEMAEPIIAALAQGPCRLGDLRQAAPGRQPSAAELLLLLDNRTTCLPLWRGKVDPETTARARRFNTAQAVEYGVNGLGQKPHAAASPLIGAGMACTALELALIAQPDVTLAAQPDATILARRLIPQADEEAMARAAATIAETFTERLPVWHRFGVI